MPGLLRSLLPHRHKDILIQLSIEKENRSTSRDKERSCFNQGLGRDKNLCASELS